MVPVHEDEHRTQFTIAAAASTVVLLLVCSHVPNANPMYTSGGSARSAARSRTVSNVNGAAHCATCSSHGAAADLNSIQTVYMRAALLDLPFFASPPSAGPRHPGCELGRAITSRLREAVLAAQ
eukprot:CAMPEP_0181170516 /NCGR_PEP_ID=MMETSP1096-20121128/1406_1 /TAXON_ID=156174 ORGANISM="Chrysochromulina ericina, Strain CCMP281" /NCGR_SAMPLE_ID=MMETSP1096 /ASSEMBLY_ACC=CAM_ASM_000453 /LENGTH=123 /DNA_ID=CAMNT_0023258079 /DNA_START=19 /DNA_END=390 /DNA_ORIENTATION=-